MNSKKPTTKGGNMEFVITGSHGETISVKDHSKTEYLVILPCRAEGGAGVFHKMVITKDQFKRLAKAS
jgi:hypothetical protein